MSLSYQRELRRYYPKFVEHSIIHSRGSLLGGCFCLPEDTCPFLEIFLVVHSWWGWWWGVSCWHLMDGSWRCGSTSSDTSDSPHDREHLTPGAGSVEEEKP